MKGNRCLSSGSEAHTEDVAKAEEKKEEEKEEGGDMFDLAVDAKELKRDSKTHLYSFII